MDFFECITVRRSVRSYKDQAVEGEIIDKILRAASLAPTAQNRQPFRLLVLPTKKYKNALKKIYQRDWFVEAPFVLLVCALPEAAWKRADGKCYADIDASIVMDHIILAATALGLGTCWIGAFDPKAARELLPIEQGWEPIAFTPLGYPADEAGARTKRKDISELIGSS